MSEPKLHHYVPQLLLRNFRAGTKDQIWCFDKQQGRAFKTSIRNAAAQSQFNTFEIDFEGERYRVSAEDKFTHIEDKVAPVIKKLLDTGQFKKLTDEEIALIAVFLHVQNRRTVNARGDVDSMMQQLRAHLGGMGCDKDHLDSLLGPSPDANDIARFALESAFNSISAVAPAYVEAKTWVLLRTSPTRPFYIGDNPVVLQNEVGRSPHWSNLGLTCPGIEIYLPLSSSLTLAIWCDTNVAAFRRQVKKPKPNLFATKLVHSIDNDQAVSYESGDDEQLVVRLNYLQGYYSERFVFCANDNFSLLSEMIAKNPRLKTGPRPILASGADLVKKDE